MKKLVQFGQNSMIITQPSIARPLPTTAKEDARLRDAAIELEANFLAEMLKNAGVGKSPNGFDGGAGEDQFASYLRLEQAREMARSGGIGLAESLFNALKEAQNAKT